MIKAKQQSEKWAWDIQAWYLRVYPIRMPLGCSGCSHSKVTVSKFGWRIRKCLGVLDTLVEYSFGERREEKIYQITKSKMQAVYIEIFGIGGIKGTY